MATKQKITLGNPDLHDYVSTILTQDVAIGGTTLNVLSSTGFQAISGATTYYYLLIGNYGTEGSEIVLASAKADSTFTVGACKFSHSSSDPVVHIPYNKVKFYGRTVSGGTNNLITILDIDCSSQSTTFDYTGTDYTYFVCSYYRSDATEDESAVSDEISMSTFTSNSVKKIIESGIRKAMTRVDENPNGVLSWNILLDIVNEGLSEILTRKKKWQCLHKVDNTLTTTANVEYISKPSDLSVMEFLYVNGNKIDYITKFNYNQYTQSKTTPVIGVPTNYTIKNDKIFLYPVPNGAYTTSFEYFSVPEVVSSLSQEIRKEFSTILIYFIAAQAAYIRNNEKRGNLMEAKFVRVLENQIEDVTGEEQSGDSVQSEQDSYVDWE